MASITRIANSTQFQGVKLLNGSMDFSVSGLNTDQIKDMQIQEVRFGNNVNMPVTVQVDTAATKGALSFIGSATTAAVTLSVQGNQGVEVFNFKAGTGRAEVASAINQLTDSTGVSAISSADLSGGGNVSGILFRSTGYGSKQFVSVNPLDRGSFDTVDSGGAASNNNSGTDATVLVNGITAVSDGLNIQITGPAVHFAATLDESINTAGSSSSFTVTGGGAQFQPRAQHQLAAAGRHRYPERRGIQPGHQGRRLSERHHHRRHP